MTVYGEVSEPQIRSHLRSRWRRLLRGDRIRAGYFAEYGSELRRASWNFKRSPVRGIRDAFEGGEPPLKRKADELDETSGATFDSKTRKKFGKTAQKLLTGANSSRQDIA